MYKNNQIELLVLPSVQNIDEIMKDSNVKITKAFYCDMEFIFKNGKVAILHNGRDISTFTAVWLSSHWSTRDLASTVKQYLDSHDIPTTYIEENSSKITDAMGFTLENILTPDTYYVRDSHILNHIEDLKEVCGFPMIMKTTTGFGGRNAELIHSDEELLNAIKNRDNSYKYMFQRFIPNDYDWGVMVANGKVVSGEKSFPKSGEFRNNCSVGATEIFVDINTIPEEIQEIAINGAKSLGLYWSRADIVIDRITEQPYLLEVNRFPGITSGSTEVVGAQEFITNYLDINGLLPAQATSKELSLLPNLDI